MMELAHRFDMSPSGDAASGPAAHLQAQQARRQQPMAIGLTRP